jgi:hypothetical protein
MPVVELKPVTTGLPEVIFAVSVLVNLPILTDSWSTTVDLPERSTAGFTQALISETGGVVSYLKV